MAVDPLMLEWLQQQGESPPPYMEMPRPFPNRFGGQLGQPAPEPEVVTQGAPPPPVEMPGRMTPNNPTGGLPRPIIQPKNQHLFGTYVSTYQQGRQMQPNPNAPALTERPTFGLGQAPVPAQTQMQPRYLDNAGNTAPPAGQIEMSPEDQWMAERFPRATSLAQQLARMQQLRDAQAVAAATPPPPGPPGPPGPAGKMGPRGPMGPARPPLQR